MENIIVLIIVGLAVGLLGRSYYKKYKKGNQGSCGCSSCPTDAACCEFPGEREKQLSESRKSMEP
jgi:hypothetical protein